MTDREREIVIAALKAAHGKFGVSWGDILGKSREAAIVEARHYAMHWCRDSGMTFGAIGRVFSRHHSSVIHAYAVTAPTEAYRPDTGPQPPRSAKPRLGLIPAGWRAKRVGMPPECILAEKMRAAAVAENARLAGELDQTYGRPRTLEEMQRAILGYLATHRPTYRSYLAVAMGVSTTKLDASITPLVAARKIEKVKKGQGVFFRLTGRVK